MWQNIENWIDGVLVWRKDLRVQTLVNLVTVSLMVLVIILLVVAVWMEAGSEYRVLVLDVVAVVYVLVVGLTLSLQVESRWRSVELFLMAVATPLGVMSFLSRYFVLVVLVPPVVILVVNLKQLGVFPFSMKLKGKNDKLLNNEFGLIVPHTREDNDVEDGFDNTF